MFRTDFEIDTMPFTIEGEHTKVFGSGEVAEARLVDTRSGLEVLSVHHQATHGIIHTVGLKWITANVGIRNYVAEEQIVLDRFPADTRRLALGHIPWNKDKNPSRPREYSLEGDLSYAEIRRVFGGRQPSWLNFYNHESMDLFWEGNLAHRAESIAVNLPFADEAMLEHCMDMMRRTTRFGNVLTEGMSLEIVDESRKMLESHLASLAINKS